MTARAAYCQCDFDPSYTGGLCDVCGKPDPVTGRAMYLLGPEDGSLSKAAMAACQSLVRFESSYCLNVAAAGTVVLYDRQAKLLTKGALVG